MKLVYERQNPGRGEELHGYVDVAAFWRQWEDDPRMPGGVIRIQIGESVTYETYEAHSHEWELQHAAIAAYERAVASVERNEVAA